MTNKDSSLALRRYSSSKHTYGLKELYLSSMQKKVANDYIHKKERRPNIEWAIMSLQKSDHMVFLWHVYENVGNFYDNFVFYGRSDKCSLSKQHYFSIIRYVKSYNQRESVWRLNHLNGDYSNMKHKFIFKIWRH